MIYLSRFPSRPVSANIVERVNRSLVLAHNDDRLLTCLEQEVLAVVFNLRHMAGKNPVPFEDTRPVCFEDRVVAVEFVRKAMRIAPRFLLDAVDEEVRHQCASIASGSW